MELPEMHIAAAVAANRISVLLPLALMQPAFLLLPEPVAVAEILDQLAEQAEEQQEAPEPPGFAAAARPALPAQPDQHWEVMVLVARHRHIPMAAAAVAGGEVIAALVIRAAAAAHLIPLLLIQS